MPRGRSRPIGSTSAIELSGTTLRITGQGTGMPFQWLLSAPPIRGRWIVWQAPAVFSAASAEGSTDVFQLRKLSSRRPSSAVRAENL
jgi:hypothetical protein